MLNTMQQNLLCIFASVALPGCSLIVPGPEDFNYTAGIDAGPPRDAGVSDAGVSDAAEPFADGGAVADGGVDTDAGEGCPPDRPTLCGGHCVDTQVDAEHCGECGVTCGAKCVDGNCRSVTSIAVGALHSCATLDDNSWACWGWNDAAQFGSGDRDGSLTPRFASTVELSSISAGGQHACGHGPGGLYCWGNNFDGRVGDGTTIDRLVPTLISGFPSVGSLAVGGGAGTSCLISGGSVYCWGQNQWGQLGDGTTEDRLSPTMVPGITAGQVAVGGGHACAQLSSSVRCWGLNNRGQLGDDSTTNSSSPVLVSGLFGEGLVVAGARHTCWLQVSSGTVRCWGRNDHGQLGDGTNTDRSIGSMEVVDLRASSLAAGLHHTCAIDSGDLFCWGLNEDGQLGDGTTTSRNQPTRVLGIDEVTAVAAGSHHTCAVRSDGSAWCWGDNEHGQLGDGSTTTRYEPVRVAW